MKEDKEIKKSRKRTCKKCGSENAELIMAHILCRDCGYDEELFKDLRNMG